MNNTPERRPDPTNIPWDKWNFTNKIRPVPSNPHEFITSLRGPKLVSIVLEITASKGIPDSNYCLQTPIDLCDKQQWSPRSTRFTLLIFNPN